MSVRRLAALTLLAGCLQVAAVEARDASRAATPPASSGAHAIPNPYAPPQPQRDRAGDAYATGFAIGLGTALINKQREDEAKRLKDEAARRR